MDRVGGDHSSFAAASLSDLCDFCLFRFRQGRAATTVEADVSAIDTERFLMGLPKLGGHPGLARLKSAMRKARPRGDRWAGAVPYAPRDIVPFLDTGTDFEALRERTLFSLRVETLLRSDSAHTIDRSTIKRARHLDGSSVVVFSCSSKSATAAGVAFDTNYVSHLADDPSHCRRSCCPACCLLALRAVVDRLPGAAGHQALFTDAAGKALTGRRLSTIITKLLRRAGVPQPFTSHSLRGSSQQTLAVLGVSTEDICVRAAWATQALSATRVANYTRHRFVRQNFARLLLLPGTVSALVVPSP